MIQKKYNNENGRKNLRLHGYDYSRAGLYFITIRVQNGIYLFGEITRAGDCIGDPMWSPTPAGCMVEKWYHEIENKFPDKQCHEMVVMPNHFHCIIQNLDADDMNAIQTDANEMDANEMDANEMDAHVGAPLRGRPVSSNDPVLSNDPEKSPDKYGIHNKKYGATIGDVMDWFKTMTTNEYIRGVKKYDWQRFNGKLWQRNYYDHIIRSEQEYFRIAEYILNNPKNWDKDSLGGNSSEIRKMGGHAGPPPHTGDPTWTPQSNKKIDK